MKDKFKGRPSCPPKGCNEYGNADKLGYFNANFTETLTRLIDGKFVDISQNTDEILGDIKTVLEYINNGTITPPNTGGSGSGSGGTGTGSGTGGSTTPPEPVKYTVTFDVNGADGGVTVDPIQVLPNTKYTINNLIPPNLVITRNGYTLIGWNTSAQSTSGLSEITFSTNTTLYAVWKENVVITPEQIKLGTPSIYFESSKIKWNYFENMATDGSNVVLKFYYSDNNNSITEPLGSTPTRSSATNYTGYINLKEAVYSNILVNNTSVDKKYYIVAQAYDMNGVCLTSDFSNILEYTVEGIIEETPDTPTIIQLKKPSVSISGNDLCIRYSDLNTANKVTAYRIILTNDNVGNISNDFEVYIYGDNTTYKNIISIIPEDQRGTSQTFSIKVKAITDVSGYTSSDYSDSVTYVYSAFVDITIRGVDTPEESETGLGIDGVVNFQYYSNGTQQSLTCTESQEDIPTIRADYGSELIITFTSFLGDLAQTVVSAYRALSIPKKSISYSQSGANSGSGYSQIVTCNENLSIDFEYHVEEIHLGE